MNKKVWLFIILAAFLFAPAAWAAPSTFTSPLRSPVALPVSPDIAQPRAAPLVAQPVAQVAGNLLVNPSFEGEYIAQDGTTIVAPGWTAFWWPWSNLPEWVYQGGSSTPIRKPEYKPLPVSVDAGRVRTGEKSQCAFVFYGVMVGGVYQTASVSPGAYVQASAYAQTWTSKADDPAVSTGEMYVAVGIDPQGGTDPWARRVQWSDWQAPSYARGEFRLVQSPIVQATDDHVTVFVIGHGKWALKHNDLYLDDAALTVVDTGGTCPEPTPCPVCPPCPTPTPCPECPGGGEPVDYGRIEAIMRQVFREEWPMP